MPSNDNIVRAKIELEDGTEISFFYELKISQRVYAHHTFELRCPLNAIESDSEPLINRSKDLFGKLIKVGFASGEGNSSAQYFFKGIITNLSVVKFQGIGGDLLIKGYSPTILLEEGRKYGTFDGKTISENVRQIMQDVPSNLLDTQVDPDEDSNTGYRVQYKESSFVYLVRLAKTYNQWLYFDGAKLYLGKKKDDEKFELTFGSDVGNMRMEYRMAPINFQIYNYNPQSDQVLVGESSSAHTAAIDDISDMLQNKSEEIFNKKKQYTAAFHPEQQSEMDDMTRVTKSRLGGQYLTVTGTCNNPHIKIGSIIKISGPNRSNPSQNDDYGKYRIIGLDQTINGSGSFSCSFVAISSGAVTPPIDVVPDYQPVEDEFATVMDNKDPEKMGRIKVQHIWQTGDEMTHWLDTSQVASGSNAGFYFVPEVGERVLLGYINGNPSYPYVKGSMYRKDNKPTDHLYADDNPARAISLSENMRIVLDKNDSVGGLNTEVIGITSYDANGANKHPNYILVSKDADSGIVIHSENHKIVITADSLKIETKKDAEVTAGGDLKVSSTGKLTIDAGTSDVEIKGMNIKISATQGMDIKGVQTTIDGTAQTKVSSSGIVEVQGTLIKLN